MTDEELRALHDRLERYEQSRILLFQRWLARLLAALPLPLVQRALETGQPYELLDTVKAQEPFQPDLSDVYLAEGRLAMEEVPKDRGLELSFDMKDPHFERAVYDQGAFLIREIDMETRRAIQTVIANARRDGLHPRQFAPQIKEMVGLTTRQAVAVENQLNAMLQGGVPPERAQKTADRYSERLRTLRAKTIARTETVRAAAISRRASFDQAARHGLFDPTRAYREWMAVQDDPREVCFQLNGTRVPFGQEFPEGDPPVHPNCRCVEWLVLE